jgi:maltose alpha-D-glucosyltransferase / alpha-amylase
MSATGLATLQIRSLADPLDDFAISGLADLLPGYLTTRRWFRTKTKTISRTELEDVVEFANASFKILIVGVHYDDGESDRYILALTIEHGDIEAGEELFARMVTPAGERATLYSALGNTEFRDDLLDSIICERQVNGRAGTLVATRAPALREKCGAQQKTESFISRAEQSNTSVIYGDRYILKLFRKLESGIHPDIEVGRFLTERGFRNTPAVLGSIEYRRQNSVSGSGAAILQQFVPNKGDAWKYTLDSLRCFFERALPSKRIAPTFPTEHPLNLIGEEIPPKLRLFVGDYLDSAALLGRRTAEMHAVFADSNSGPDFQPEAFTSGDSAALSEELLRQSEQTFALLRSKRASTDGELAESVDRLLQLETRITARFTAIRNLPISAVRMRFHGDYHLGQVLYTGQDFMIIDFEGEPAKPLAERRAKALALRDVAGMIRSFQYAAFAALFGQVPGIPTDPESKKVVEGWAAAWNAVVSSAYLRAYFERAGGASFVPAGWQERRVLLDVFLLQKALYEVSYELNNRPDWLPIPLRGILSLLQN